MTLIPYKKMIKNGKKKILIYLERETPYIFSNDVTIHMKTSLLLIFFIIFL